VFSLAFTVVLVEDLFASGWVYAGRKTASMLLTFVVFPVAIHSFYRWILPNQIARVPHGWRRWLVHLVVPAAIALPVAALTLPLRNAICGLPMPLQVFANQSVVMSWAIVLPSVALQQWRRRYAHAERLLLAARRAALEAELRALQARTNPHFLFNSLNVVASLIPDDPVLAERTLERLA
jgi:two-component system sensor histidine kinase AlgZ